MFGYQRIQLPLIWSLLFLAFNVFADERAFQDRVAKAAFERTHHKVTYDPAYVQLKYPGGDVPPNTGVCTDVVIRTYRTLGIDLQKDVHEDMKAHFSLYPKIYGLKKPDTSIDHRRVPNLRVFFERKGKAIPLTKSPEDYLPGDLVTWILSTGQTHIGIVSDRKVFLTSRHKIIHNIGAGDVLEDVLFDWEITGHYRYYGSPPRNN